MEIWHSTGGDYSLQTMVYKFENAWFAFKMVRLKINLLNPY